VRQGLVIGPVSGIDVGTARRTARFDRDCTPREPFQGRQPTGSRVVFAEHVFYRFHDDRITEVWSLLDVAALDRQLPPS
jgi:predicted ester cyclase